MPWKLSLPTVSNVSADEWQLLVYWPKKFDCKDRLWVYMRIRIDMQFSAPIFHKLITCDYFLYHFGDITSSFPPKLESSKCWFVNWCFWCCLDLSCHKALLFVLSSFFIVFLPDPLSWPIVVTRYLNSDTWGSRAALNLPDHMLLSLLSIDLRSVADLPFFTHWLSYLDTSHIFPNSSISPVFSTSKKKQELIKKTRWQWGVLLNLFD